jgi:hypothetical protein
MEKRTQKKVHGQTGGEGLYQTLISGDLSNEPLSENELKKMEKVSLLSEEFALAIRDLIKTHYLREISDASLETPEESKDPPYKGIQNREGLSFDSKNLPIKLVRMILKFIDIVSKQKIECYI